MKRRRPGIERLWQPRSTPAWIAARALTPLALVYRGALAVRAPWWRVMAQESPIPVVSVGNLTVGGNGKTPFTLFLARALYRGGYRVGIVSRGYGRSQAGAVALLAADRGELLADLASAGDEPRMMARGFDGPIAVARRRIDAIRLLAQRQALDLVLLDDGFQHIRLRRAVDVVLVSGSSGLRNRALLPAGPLREPIGALRRADAVVMVSWGELAEAECAKLRKLSGPRPRILRASLKPQALINASSGEWREQPLTLGGRRVAAISGIAKPENFEAMLRELGAEIVGALAYPDHHVYTQRDWDEIRAAANAADVIITTEKDLVKLEAFSPALPSLSALRLEVTMSGNDEELLMDLISSRIAIARRRAADGEPARTGI